MYPSLFLIGTQRSGTTLFGKMLTAHKDIFIKNEVPVRRVFKPGSTQKDIQSAIDCIVEEQLGQSIDKLLVNEGKSIWGLKDPQLTEYLDDLKQFLPDTKFIIIIRDARAVVRSYIENAWGLGTNCYTGALRWRREVQTQLSFEKEVHENCMRIRFEDLIADPKVVLESVCDFMGLPFDESMLNYAKKKSFVSKNRQSINTFKPLDPVMSGKWRTELSKHQIKVINYVCGELLELLEYEVGDRYAKIPMWLKLYYRIHQMIIGEIQIQYRWRIKGYIRSYNHWRKKKL
jgi:hypothetical protein